MPPAPVKENSVDVFVTNGISGLNISEIKTQNKWIKSIQSLNQENNNTQNNVSQQQIIPNTGFETPINFVIFIISLSFSIFFSLNKKQKIN